MGFGKKSKGDKEAKAVVPVPASLPTERKQARMIINPEAVARMKDAKGQKEELKTKRTPEEVKRIIIVAVSTIVAIILFLIGMNLSEPIMLGSIKINTIDILYLRRPTTKVLCFTKSIVSIQVPVTECKACIVDITKVKI